MEYYGKIQKQCLKLQEKYPDYNNYLLYHILAGGSPSAEYEEVDFEGEDSVINFLESLENN